VVDGFRLKSDRIEAFFLSHFHGDLLLALFAFVRIADTGLLR